MKASLLFFACALAGCAAQPQVEMEWAAQRADAAPFGVSRDRCAYESTAATQAPDYSYRSALGQSLDQQRRRDELFVLCMRAQGYAQQIKRSDALKAQDAHWAELERQWEVARSDRIKARADLTANPNGPNAAELSERIRQLNLTVRSLERRLSYAPTAAVSTDHNSTAPD
ncbi:hypothetical protein [Pseudacidovorax intermedius]|uniref:hypothetical protein n=1 Tax=Pseudacidovorax intermedius TaxID=433924 RepID=UPI00128EF55D|nr:hypothetical protein [Pseudacidovorax intermedius]